MRGTGGLPPRRADQYRQPSQPGQAPGSSAGTVFARLVIVSGTGEGIFVYNGQPALGNPPIAWTSSSSVDPYGNVLPTSTASIGVSGLNGAYIALLPSTGGSTVPQVILAPGGATIAAQLPALFAAIAGAGTAAERYAFNVTSGYSTAGAGYGTTLFGQGAAGDGSADGFASLTVGSAAGSPTGIWYATPQGLIAQVPITAKEPGGGFNTPEIWHPVTLDAGWSNVAGRAVCQYRLDAFGNVEFTGAASHASFTNTTVNINGSNPLGSAYTPQNNHIYRPYSASDTGQAAIELSNGGILVARATGAGITAGAAANAEIDGSCSLL